MLRSLIAVAAVSTGAWALGTESGPAKNSSCCFPSAACCTAGDECCFSFTSALVDEKPGEAKEVKLTGTLVCGSCKLKESKKCTNVLQVKEKDKTINYWLNDKGNDEPYHENICGGGELKNVTVTGTVTEKDGKKTVKVVKFEVKK
jgi:hypothetical protein